MEKSFDYSISFAPKLYLRRIGILSNFHSMTFYRRQQVTGSRVSTWNCENFLLAIQDGYEQNGALDAKQYEEMVVV
jgi:hypothetical protein